TIDKQQSIRMSHQTRRDHLQQGAWLDRGVLVLQRFKHILRLAEGEAGHTVDLHDRQLRIFRMSIKARPDSSAPERQFHESISCLFGSFDAVSYHAGISAKFLAESNRYGVLKMCSACL